MPTKLDGSTGVLTRKGIRQPYAGVLLYSSVTTQTLLDSADLLTKCRQQLIRKRHHAVPTALATDDPHQPVIEVDILDPQAHQLDTPKTGAVQHRHLQIMELSHSRQQDRYLSLGQHHWQLPLSLRAPEARQITYRLAKELRLQKHNRIERQRLSTCRNIPLRRQEGQKPHDMHVTQHQRMPLVVEQDEKLDPIQVGTNRAPTVAVDAHEVFDRLQKWRPCHD